MQRQLEHYDRHGFGTFRGGIAPVVAAFENAAARASSHAHTDAIDAAGQEAGQRDGASQLSARDGSRSAQQRPERVQQRRRRRPGATLSLTSESVSEGEPDEVADRVADAILDALLVEDAQARLACGVSLGDRSAVVNGTLQTTATVDIPQVIRTTLSKSGLRDPEAWQVALELDARESAASDDPTGVTLFGYATAETEELMPLPIVLAHRMCRRIAEVRKAGILPYLHAGGRVEVTVRYEVDQHGLRHPIDLERVSLAVRQDGRADVESLLRPDMIDHVLHPTLPEAFYNRRRLEHDCDYFSLRSLRDPWSGHYAGPFGASGQKLDVDTYGGVARCGAAKLSGNDPGRIERAGAYAARHLAKNVVRAGMADRCEVGLSYAAEQPHPSLSIQCFETAHVPLERITALLEEHFDLRPEAIVEGLDLRRPIFTKTACYGHFGRADPDFMWERTVDKGYRF